MKKTLILTEKDKLFKVNFDKENPFIRILSVKSEMDISELSGFLLKYKVDQVNGKRFEDSIDLEFDHKSKELSGDSRLNLKEAKKLALYFTVGAEEEISSVRVKYELIDRLPIQIPTAGFSEHLADSRNIKIFFSAPFGQGKSTFLDQYFSEREGQFRVFKLFPVNYSVSGNEDIFEYIKCELILQLMEKMASFESEELPLPQNLQDFLEKDGLKLAEKLWGLASLMGISEQMNDSELVKPFLILASFLKDSYEKFKKKNKISELSKAYAFLTTFTEKKGSIFESDYFTQLIRDLLIRFKETTSKIENVLIIDDLDRMDADHIFRILNVFSAHYDTFHQTTTHGNNKFGFDRIILVGDLENIRKIYAHRYGANVDFNGYMNKYFSTKPFSYKNSEVMLTLVKDIDATGMEFRTQSSIYWAFDLLVKPLVNSNEIGLRALIGIRKIGLMNTAKNINDNQKLPNEIRGSRWSATIDLLLDTMGYHGLVKSVSSLTELKEFKHKNFLNNCCISLISIIDKSFKVDYFHDHRSQKFHVKSEMDYDETQYYKYWPRNVSIKQLPNNKTNSVEIDADGKEVFTLEHFKEFLIKVIHEIHYYRQHV